jgi:cell division protein ZapB
MHKPSSYGEQVTDSIGEQFARLEQRIDLLLRRCDRLQAENQMLRSAQEALTAERAGLLEKNEQARSRVEAMINRLKAMEQH